MHRFVNAAHIVECARNRDFAVPALNANGANYDITRAIIETAAETESPLIIQAYDDNIQYRGYDYFAELVGFLTREVDVPVAVMLDHGKGRESIMRAVRAGFSGVMVDCAGLAFEPYVKLVNRVIEFVRPLGVAVEGEVSVTAEAKNGGSVPRCSPEAVKKFAGVVDADMLAVPVGTAHGVFERQDYLDLELLQTIDGVTDLPLVLHGTCGLDLELVSRAARCGMDKINFGEIFRLNYIDYYGRFRDSLEHEGHTWRISRACTEELKKDTRRLIDALGCGGKAGLVCRPR